MLPVVSRLKQKIGNLVYCFSTFISETPISKLQVGKIKTDGGTAFDPIADHILKNKFKSALILTDGESYLSDSLAQKLISRKVHITVGWTVNAPSTSSLSKIASKTFYVFKE